MTVIYLAMIGSWLIFSSSVLLAFIWAVRRGHFDDFDGAAASIFDDDEPYPSALDRFPRAVPGPQDLEEEP